MRGRRDRVQDLLADRALWGLSRSEESELHSAVMATGTRQELDSWEYAAGAATVTMLSGLATPLPAGLLGRLQNDAVGFLARQRGVRTAGKRSLLLINRALAAAIIVAVSAFLWVTLVESVSPSLQQRMALLLESPDSFQSEWQPGPSPLHGNVRGELVWSDAEQEGYMLFTGLPVNDPGESQYQLWIFDATRSPERPVDGGVFDIPSAASEVRIPVYAKLHVGQATMFAITVERPGGVVVSEREHIVALAGP